MTTQYEGAGSREHLETRKNKALLGNIDYLLFLKSGIVTQLNGKQEDGQQAIIKILGGGLQLPGRVRPAEIGLVNVSYRNLVTGGSTTESTTIAVDKRHYKLDDFGVQVTDEYPEDASQDEDIFQTMFDIVTPDSNRVNVEWTDLLSKFMALEQLELHPEWDFSYIPPENS